MSKRHSTAQPDRPSRSSGILLHVTSLPSRYGIGDLGPAAYAWIDRLAETRQSWWQTLPLNMPDESNSPYSAISAFAGNIHLISPEMLARDGLLDLDATFDASTKVGRVDFDQVRLQRRAGLLWAHDQFRHGKGGRPLHEAYKAFVAREKRWLNDAALFMALKEAHADQPWYEWPLEHHFYSHDNAKDARRQVGRFFDAHRFYQFIFDRQISALRAHAKKRGVKILGDVPIYVSQDSADVWANPHLFQLDRDRRPTRVSGVPPDIFSKIGQRWNNPLFNWRAMQEDGYRWWIDRIKTSLRHADVLRIDHFRGLQAYWSIPEASKTAKHGKWVTAPGDELLAALKKSLGGLPLVAEDLGLITPEVLALRDRFGLAGMQILQFAFVGGDQPALPHNHVRNSIVYPANHDNDTCVGWWKHLPRDQRERARAYAPGIAHDPANAMIRLAMGSVADRVIVQLQDVLGLGSTDRMNQPGTSTQRLWSWRVTETQLRSKRLDDLATMTEAYFRARQS